MLSISEDCCSIASSYQTVRYGNIYNSLARLYKFNVDTPWKDLSEEAQRVFLYGTEQKWTRVTFTHPEKRTRWVEFVQWRRRHCMKRTSGSSPRKARPIAKKWPISMIESICPACQAARIKPYPAETQTRTA